MTYSVRLSVCSAAPCPIFPVGENFMLIDSEFSVAETLLTHKKLAPLSSQQTKEIKQIQELCVGDFTEADVRGEIIDPIIRVLGYKKGQFSSVDREKHIRFLGKTSKYIDYSITVWRENFWLIEAKKPLPGDHFGYSELRQVTEYSIHPEINAAIIVLCDGRKLEVFDREENLETPILSFKIAELEANFDSLRKILSPINVWYFYKRRVLRSIDKAFEAEFNQSRVNEFLQIVETRLAGKRNKILENFQSTSFVDRVHGKDFHLESADDIIDIHFFLPLSRAATQEMSNSLVRKCLEGNGFHVIHRMFPDQLRDANDNFYMHALGFLIELEKKAETMQWLPSWLDPERTKRVEVAIIQLARLMLSHFKMDESRKTAILASATYRRIFKIFSHLSSEQKMLGKLRHLVTRFELDEFSWQQIVSSPEGNILAAINVMTIEATNKFVKEHSVENNKFNTNIAKLRLAELWELEANILERTPNYKDIMREFDLGEFTPTEASSIVYDNLGHGCLCILKSSEKWTRHVIANHSEDLAYLTSMGSWAAREIAGEKLDIRSKEACEADAIQRFFFGDGNVYKRLVKLYQFNYG